MGLEVGGGGTEEEKEKIPLCESIGHRPLRLKLLDLDLDLDMFSLRKTFKKSLIKKAIVVI